MAKKLSFYFWIMLFQNSLKSEFVLFDICIIFEVYSVRLRKTLSDAEGGRKGLGEVYIYIYKWIEWVLVKGALHDSHGRGALRCRQLWKLVIKHLGYWFQLTLFSSLRPLHFKISNNFRGNLQVIYDINYWLS